MIDIFKTELHCHSTEVSACSKITATQLRDRYISAGYDTVVLTNHFATVTYEHLKCTDWQDFIDKYIYGYSLLKNISKGQLEILLAIEIRPKDSPNDYLMYGVSEKFLRENELLFNKSVEKLSKLSRENGILFIQAHPFRDYMQITSPTLLDGIEVFNGDHGGYYGADSRNDIAKAYADKYEFIKTSGTDLHYPNDKILGGITTSEKIRSIPQLIEILKNGNYNLIQD